MRQGFKVENLPTYKGCEFIIVSNYDGLNEILNSPLCSKNYSFNGKSDIGVWKPKQLKQ